MVAAFASEGIDIAFDEATGDDEFRHVIEQIDRSRVDAVTRVKQHLIAANVQPINEFFAALDARLGHHVRRVLLIPLYSRINEFAALDGAIDFLDAHPIYEGSGEFRKYEIRVEFSNGDKVEASFVAKEKEREFLRVIATQ